MLTNSYQFLFMHRKLAFNAMFDTTRGSSLQSKNLHYKIYSKLLEGEYVMRVVFEVFGSIFRYIFQQ